MAWAPEQLGPRYSEAVNRLGIEIGDVAAGLISRGFPPPQAVSIATNRVMERRVQTAKTMLTAKRDNVVPLFK